MPITQDPVDFFDQRWFNLKFIDQMQKKYLNTRNLIRENTFVLGIKHEQYFSTESRFNVTSVQ